MASKKVKPVIDSVASELRKIYNSNRKRLHPANVVEAARDADSPLHSCFEWDDSVAAEQHRLQQARQLIATVQISIPKRDGNTVQVRAYHQLRQDGKGYRRTMDVMANPGLKATLLAQFASDLERLQERYETLREVAAARKVLAALDEFVRGRKAG